MAPLNEVRQRGPNSPDILWTDGLVVTLRALGPSQNAACFSLHSSGGNIMSNRKRKQTQGKSVEGRLRIVSLHIDGFRSWLQRIGYRPTTIVEVVRLLACWADWLQASGFTLDNIIAGFDASAALFKGSKTIRAPHERAPCLSDISGNKERCRRPWCRHLPQKYGLYSEHSGRGCEASGASPTQRSTPIRPACRSSQESWRRSKSLHCPSSTGFCS